MIPSVYNFVPLSKHVFLPEWSEQVSMDVPFSDGVNGQIEIEIETLTSTYIRSGGVHPENNKTDNKAYLDFFRVTSNGNYAIPGTSLKGVIRNVLEIASFSKIAVKNHRYGVRDLYNKDKDFYSGKLTTTTSVPDANGARQMAYKAIVKAGWLEEGENSKTVTLTECDFARIEQDDIENRFNNRIAVGTRRESGVEKIQKFENNNLSFEDIFSIDQEKAHSHSCGYLSYKKATYTQGKNGVKGTLVVTGQPMPRQAGKRKRKHMEFVFFNEKPAKLSVAENVYKDFCFIHSEDNGQPNEEWEYWREKLHQQKRVPVFWLSDDEGKVSAIGLAMMFRLPYRFSIHEAVLNTSPDHNSTSKDLAETIFGYIDDKKALKGRVSFGTMMAKNDAKVTKKVTTILNGPKPTFYPYYVKQKNLTRNGDTVEKYSTLMDEDCEISGWKRYPVKEKPEPATASKGQENVTTAFTPLPAQTKFTGLINIHNLRKSELGALLWALSFGNNNNACHSTGMAKPYGYGATKITIKGGKLFSNTGQKIDILKEQNEFIASYEKLMNDFLNKSGEKVTWNMTPQIQNLLVMAEFDQRNLKNQQLRYPKMEMGGYNGFVEMKKDRVYLKPYIPEIHSGSGRYVSSHSGRSTQSYRNGDKVTCEVIEETTKNGNPKFKIVGGSESDIGILKPGTKEPDDLTPGTQYEAILSSYSPKQCQFTIK